MNLPEVAHEKPYYHDHSFADYRRCIDVGFLVHRGSHAERDCLREAKLYYHDSGELGLVRTAVGEGTTVRIDQLSPTELAQLAADLLGEPQPGIHPQSNVKQWVIRYGRRQHGDRRFLREVAQALVWGPHE